MLPSVFLFFLFYRLTPCVNVICPWLPSLVYPFCNIKIQIQTRQIAPAPLNGMTEGEKGMNEWMDVSMCLSCISVVPLANEQLKTPEQCLLDTPVGKKELFLKRKCGKNELM